MEFGQHFELKSPVIEIEQNGEGALYRMVLEQMVAFEKATNSLITDSLIQKAKEHGITDLYVLNEDFIISAIREKMEQESGCPYCRPDSEGYIRKFGAFSIHDGYLETGHCKPQKIQYCPQCGAKMDDPKGD